MSKKVISFSVWGSDTKYTAGAMENVKLQKVIYPDWICRFYCGNNVPSPMVEGLKMMPCEVVEIDRDGDKDGLFWRFYPVWDPEVDVFVSRDCDSRLSKREADAVAAWLSSDKVVHVMRDSPSHATSIMGGMWGGKKGFMPEFKQELDAYVAAMQPTAEGDHRTKYFNADQHFLEQKVWPVVRMKTLAHDEFHHYTGMEQPFPSARDGSHFVGE